MSDLKILELANFYRETARGTLEDLTKDELIVDIPYVMWLAGEIENLIVAEKRERALRHLGFLEGVLWTNGILSISQIADLHKEQDHD